MKERCNKNCSNCHYKNQPASEEPCLSCSDRKPTSNWKPEKPVVLSAAEWVRKRFNIADDLVSVYNLDQGLTANGNTMVEVFKAGEEKKDIELSGVVNAAVDLCKEIARETDLSSDGYANIVEKYKKLHAELNFYADLPVN